MGAIWAVCNQDVSVDGVIARLGQVDPAVLVASDGSVYGGKRIDRAFRWDLGVEAGGGLAQNNQIVIYEMPLKWMSSAMK